MKFHRAEDVQKLVDDLEESRDEFGANQQEPQGHRITRETPEYWRGYVAASEIAERKIKEALSAFQTIRPIEISEEFDVKLAHKDALKFKENVWLPPVYVAGRRDEHGELIKNLRGET